MNFLNVFSPRRQQQPSWKFSFSLFWMNEWMIIKKLCSGKDQDHFRIIIIIIKISSLFPKTIENEDDDDVFVMCVCVLYDVMWCYDSSEQEE